jgi:hypothetical protein
MQTARGVPRAATDEDGGRRLLDARAELQRHRIDAEAADGSSNTSEASGGAVSHADAASSLSSCPGAQPA